MRVARELLNIIGWFDHPVNVILTLWSKLDGSDSLMSTGPRMSYKGLDFGISWVDGHWIR